LLAILSEPVIPISDLQSVWVSNVLPASHQALVHQTHHGENQRRRRSSEAPLRNKALNSRPSISSPGITLQNGEDRLFHLCQHRHSLHPRSHLHGQSKAAATSASTIWSSMVAIGVIRSLPNCPNSDDGLSYSRQVFPAWFS